jgi:uncharacterized membrane protein
MMVAYHAAFSISYFGIARFAVTTGFARMFAITTASLFIFLAGLSLHISRCRGGPNGRGWQGFVLRGAGILVLGGVITAVTLVFVPESAVLFGILHLIGTMILISPVLPRSPVNNYLLGLTAIFAGIVFLGIRGSLWTVPLGIRPVMFASLDYVPVFPWAGVFLIGLGAGSLLYPDGAPRAGLARPRSRAVDGITFLGRHSLVIYMVHVPIILLVLGILFPGVFRFFLPG